MSQKVLRITLISGWFIGSAGWIILGWFSSRECLSEGIGFRVQYPFVTRISDQLPTSEPRIIRPVLQQI